MSAQHDPQTLGDDGYKQSSRDSRRRGSDTVGIIGLVGGLVGATLLIIGFTVLDWYSHQGFALKFSDIHTEAGDHVTSAFTTAYFDWMGWILLALVVLTAILANLPIGSGGTVFRGVAPVVGVAGIVITLVALNNFWDAFNSGSDDADLDTFKHSTVGLYVTLLGFLVAGVAGAFGPRRA